eukprot:Rhum_TRINITY_DN18672_c0_g1::Rhum_TRINITY_DN18672_c0_g1_i1::g.168055::m.168055/K04994/MCOLN3; mucolipin 3
MQNVTKNVKKELEDAWSDIQSIVSDGPVAMVRRVNLMLVFNVVLAVLTLTYTLTFQPWENSFRGDSYDRLGTAFSPNFKTLASTKVFFHTMPTVQDFMHMTHAAWLELENDQLASWTDITPLTMELTYLSTPYTYKNISVNSALPIERSTITCPLTTSHPLGPFGADKATGPLGGRGTVARSPFRAPRPAGRAARKAAAAAPSRTVAAALGGARDFVAPADNRVGAGNATGADPCKGLDKVWWRADTALVSFTLESTEGPRSGAESACHKWRVEQQYRFRRAGVVEFTLDIGESVCRTAQADGAGKAIGVVVLVVMGVAAVSLILKLLRLRSVRAFKLEQRRVEYMPATRRTASGQSFHKLTQQRSSGIPGAPEAVGQGTINDTYAYNYGEDVVSITSAPSTVSTTPSMKRQELYEDLRGDVESVVGVGGNMNEAYTWLCLGVVGDIFCLLWTAFKWRDLSTDGAHGSLIATRGFLGLGAFVQWATLVGHLGDHPWFYLLIHSLQYGIPAGFRHILSCLPLYFGYAFIGTYLFGGHTVAFATLDISCVSLFAVLNGDVVHDTFDEIYGGGGMGSMEIMKILSRIYLYTFITLFIYVVLNVFLAIMEDTYWQIKQALVIDLKEDLLDEKKEADAVHMTSVADMSGLVQTIPLAS